MYCSGDCSDPQAIPHAEVDGGSTIIGSVRNYGCLDGYSPIGSGSVTCLDNSTWNSPVFECAGLELILYGVTGSRGHGVTGSRGHVLGQLYLE
jgi:hypothetical protein